MSTSREFEIIGAPPAFQALVFRAVAERAEQLADAADHRAAHPLHQRAPEG